MTVSVAAGVRRAALHRREQLVIILGTLALGLFVVFHAQIRSGFREGLGHPNDPRLVNYLLEHSLHCLTTSSSIECLENPPFFFPQQRVSFTTETFWGLLPIYALSRIFVSDPEAAYVGFVLLLASLNFLASLALFHKGLDLDVGSSSAAAFLFAFAGPRSAILHQSFSFAQFPWLLAVLALAWEAKQVRPHRHYAIPVLSFWLALTWQFYSYLYTAWFGVLFLVLSGAVTLAVPGTRPFFARTLRNRWKVWLLGFSMALLLIAPLLMRYLEQFQVSNGASWPWIEARLPHPESWLNQGPRALTWRSLQTWAPIRDLQEPQWHPLGLGLVTTALSVLGLWELRHRRWFLPVVAPVALLLLASTRLPGGICLWKWVVEYVPGAPAFRFVHRVYQIALIAPAAGFGCALGHLFTRSRHRYLIPVLITGICVVEQVRLPWTYSLAERAAVSREIAARVPPSCKSFFYSPLGGQRIPLVAQIDAMWASRTAGVPTINGFSGYQPPSWDLKKAAIHSEADESRLRAALETWLALNALEDTCWLKIEWSGVRSLKSEVEILRAPIRTQVR